VRFTLPTLRLSKTGLWSARKVIPADIREAYGKREEKKTWPSELSQGQAKAELAAWLVPIEERIAQLRAVATQSPVTFTKRQSRALAGEWYKAQVAKYEDDPGRAEDWWFAREELEPEDPEDREEGRFRPVSWLVAARDTLLADRALLLSPASADALLQVS